MGTIYGGATAAAPGQQSALQIAAVQAMCRRQAGWIGIVAVLTVVNSAGVAAGLDWNFLMGLGITTIIDIFAKKGAGTAGSVVAVAVAVIAGALFGLLWNFARKGASWAFLVAGILYALDTLVYLLLAMAAGALWLNVALHGLALFYIFKGVGSAGSLKKLLAQQAAAVPGVISSSAPS